MVKHAFELQSKFLYGDFRPYLEAAAPDSVDFVLAVGVLYHMLQPLKLLRDIAQVTPAFGLWTHYYDPALCGKDLRFSPRPTRQTLGELSAEVYEQHYLSSLATKRFIGGTEPTSAWLTRQGLLDSIEKLGFTITLGDESLTHPNGPCILLFAKRA